MTVNQGIEFKKKNPFKLLTQSEYDRILKEKFKIEKKCVTLTESQ